MRNVVLILLLAIVACDSDSSFPNSNQYVGHWTWIDQQAKRDTARIEVVGMDIFAVWLGSDVGYNFDFELIKDQNLNLDHGINPNLGPGGTWQAQFGKLTLFTLRDVYGQKRRDTLSFKVQLESRNVLRLEDDYYVYHCERLP